MTVSEAIRLDKDPMSPPSGTLSPQAELFLKHITAISNMIGSSVCRNIYRYHEASDTMIDYGEDGESSCAAVASVVLFRSGFLNRMHATVTSTIDSLQEKGWDLWASEAGSYPVPGTVAVWPSAASRSGKHIGFYVGQGRAVSNSSYDRVPVVHGLRLRDGTVPSHFLDSSSLLVGNMRYAAETGKPSEELFAELNNQPQVRPSHSR